MMAYPRRHPPRSCAVAFIDALLFLSRFLLKNDSRTRNIGGGLAWYFMLGPGKKVRSHACMCVNACVRARACVRACMSVASFEQCMPSAHVMCVAICSRCESLWLVFRRQS